jgi:hypothetical protein
MRLGRRRECGLEMARASTHIWPSSCSVATSYRFMAALWRMAARCAAGGLACEKFSFPRSQSRDLGHPAERMI